MRRKLPAAPARARFFATLRMTTTQAFLFVILSEAKELIPPTVLRASFAKRLIRDNQALAGTRPMTSILQRVSRYYRQQGISPASFASFRCPHKDDCKEHTGTAPGRQFVCGRGPEISQAYERDRLPRVLVLSLDWGGDGGSKPSERRARRVGRATSGRLQQYREEQEIATHLLRASHKHHRDLKWEDVHRFYARTNSIKCCANRTETHQAPPRLFAKTALPMSHQ